MKRPLWVQKLSDAKLKEMITYAESIETTGEIRFIKARNIINTWYDHHTGMERGVAFCIDVYKEACFRWIRHSC